MSTGMFAINNLVYGKATIRLSCARRGDRLGRRRVADPGVGIRRRDRGEVRPESTEVVTLLGHRPTEAGPSGVLEERIDVRRQVQALAVFGGGQRRRIVRRDRRDSARRRPACTQSSSRPSRLREQSRVHRLGADHRDAAHLAGEDPSRGVVDELLRRVAPDAQESRRDVRARVVRRPRAPGHCVCQVNDDTATISSMFSSIVVAPESSRGAFEGLDHQVERLLSRRVRRARNSDVR